MFELKNQVYNLRQAVLETGHSKISSPFFMPVATKGSIRGIGNQEMNTQFDTEIILMNTYHLYLKPGYELVHKLGGLHQFTNWPKAILTDSGGFQVFSLSKINKITEEGVYFRSHIDGSQHLLSPEESIRTQYYLGSDIIMVLDECPPGGSNRDYILKSLELTTRWAQRSKLELERLLKVDPRPDRTKPLLFGIVQGGIYEDLRKLSLSQLQEIGFDGYAIGGVSVGESRDEVLKVINWTAPLLPEDKPRYLMGLGKPEEIAYASSLGVDMFDCVIPTREARHGTVYIWKSANKEQDLHQYLRDLQHTQIEAKLPVNKFFDILKIQNLVYREDTSTIDPYAQWSGSQDHTRAYIRHLYNVREQYALEYLSRHNLQFYLEMMRYIRSFKV
jgi:queuine tRNA-ribosyltransferase